MLLSSQSSLLKYQKLRTKRTISLLKEIDDVTKIESNNFNFTLQILYFVQSIFFYMSECPVVTLLDVATVDVVDTATVALHLGDTSNVVHR